MNSIKSLNAAHRLRAMGTRNALLVIRRSPVRSPGAATRTQTRCHRKHAMPVTFPSLDCRISTRSQARIVWVGDMSGSGGGEVHKKGTIAQLHGRKSTADTLYRCACVSQPGSEPASQPATCLNTLYRGEDAEHYVAELVEHAWRVSRRVAFNKERLTSHRVSQAGIGIAENRKNAEAFVCVILSHGWHGHFMCCDGTKVHYKDIYSLFNNKAWEHKLKLFIIQACRGDSTDSGAKLEEGENCEQTQESGNRDDASSSLDEACILNDDLFAPPETLTFFSTPEGYVSYRPKLSSCQFIEFVREELTRAWEQRVELVQSLTRVSRRIARDFQSNSKKEQYNGKKQMPCLVSHLTRDVYLVQRQSYTQ
uniref:Caspase-3-like isoform X2 n=1 Tax=Petromyzon marinus TaxID=7757 RepID=A0AAJ7SNQ5_PETMA|nr:caspase-3-like isoform X2 [Petromyzon marinus]